jgi:hypothetical protein
MTAQAKIRYPRKAQIERAVAAAKACGIDVTGFEVSPDGIIRIIEARTMPATPTNDFERFQDKL